MADKEEILSSNSFSDDEQRSAVDAYNAFQQGRYDSCIETLDMLRKNHPGDCKVMHNRAVAEFFKSGQTRTGDLKKSLSKVHKVSQQSHQEDDDLGDDAASNEHSTLHYNQALLLYFFHQYQESQSMLEPLAENPEVTHNVKEILLLLAEACISNHEPEKANRIISRIEENFPKPTSPQSKQGSGSDGKEKGKAQKLQGKDVKNCLPLMKARCSLQMKSMKACKRELKAFSNLDSGSDIPPQTIQTISVFLKSNFEFLRGNFHKAYKLLGSSPPSTSINTSWMQNGESLFTMFYNNLGVIHFCMSKHNLGSFYMNKALDENDKTLSANPVMSTTSSRKGDKHQQRTASGNAKTLQMLNMNKKFELLYNAGIQLLYSGRPSAAFDCLISAVQVFYSNPRLWLRLAECCIQSCCSPDKHETSSSPSRRSKYHTSTMPYTLVGSGIHQKMIVHPISQNWTGTGNSVMPGPTLEFASVCLHNALTILAEAGVSGLEIIESKKNSKNEPTNKKQDVSVSGCPIGPISGQELSNLHASILANSAFVALSLGNNLIAYEHSKVLLQLPNLSNRHRYLGKMYSAEALVSLDRISDAIQHLSSDTITDLSDESSGKSQSNVDDPSSQTVHKPRGPKSTQCCFKSAHHAQGCMLLNQAVAHSLRSEFEKAQRLLNQFAVIVPPQDVPPHAILLAVYVALHTSGLQSALKILQHNSLPPHTSASMLTSSQMIFRPAQPMSKQYSANGVVSSPSGTASSSGSVSGSSTGSRSKSSTPQPQYSNPPSGSVTPERVVKSSQSATKNESGGSKTKRGRR